MSTQSLPSEEWTAFFDDFSRKYEGKLASIELYGPGTMEHNAARELPFVGISYDRKGSDAGSVRVTLGDAPKDSLTHEIPHVNHVWTRAPNR